MTDGHRAEVDYRRLIFAGAEPRVQPRLAFVAQRQERATLSIHSRFEPAGGEATDELLELDLAIHYPDATHAELRVVRAATTAADIPGIESTVGVTMPTTIHAMGLVDAPQVHAPAAASPRAVEYVRGALVQAAPVLVPTLPEQSIGDGARWGADDLHHTLIAHTDEAVVVERRGSISYQASLPDGRRVDVLEEQRYRIEAPLDGLARHMEATLEVRGSDGTCRSTRLYFDVERR